MTRKSKRILARILAVVLAVTLVPSNTWGTANVVRAEETTEAFTKEDADVSTDEVSTKILQEPQEEAGEKETSEPSVVADDGKDSDSAPVDAEETLENDKKPEVKEEKKETEKVSAETDNKSEDGVHVHNFTDADGNYTTASDYFIIAGSEKSKAPEITYNGLTLKKAIKMENNVISFNAKSKGNLTLVFLNDTTGGKRIKVDDTNYTGDAKGVVTAELEAGEHKITKGDSGNLYYISFVETGAAKEKVATPTASSDSGEVKVGDTITLSCATEGATIYYTTDGTEPKNNANKETYSDGITVATKMVSDSKITIKAYASKTDCTDSETETFIYNVSTTPGENQLKSPTAEPDAGEVPKGTEIQLKSQDGAPIYYTKDGTIPGKDNGMLFADSNPIIINEETVIKAIAINDEKDDSFVVSFRYTIKKPTIKVDDSSKSVISDVTLDGDVTFTNGTEEVFDISLKAVENTNTNNPVKTAAEAIKEDGGKILYYDFSLVNNKSTSDTVSIANDATGTLKIKMPYTIASDVNKRNKITVVNATDKIEPSKDSAGFVFDADSVGTYAVVINPAGAAGALKILESEGYEEGAYAEWEAVEGAEGYMAYVAPAGGKYVRIDDELIREYDDYWRVDTVGLAKGTYYIKIKAVVLGKNGDTDTATVISSAETDPLRVTNYDRSGFAFSSKSTYKTGSGAYNDDGTLKEGAKVLYVTAKTAKTVTLDVQTDKNGKIETFTGIQAIINAKQKGYDTTPWAIRIIGCVTDGDLDAMLSSAEGLQIKGNNVASEMNITLEGIGEDAVVKGFGFLIRGCGNVELRNFGILYFMDDGVSVDTDNCNIWIHDLDIFYGKKGSAKDQVKGDGSIDVKAGSTYVTVSYNHFWDSGKCSLCGMKDDIGHEFMVTYHHNWFDHSDSRHPRIRGGTIHIYNNYFDGNSKYGVGVTTGSSAFVESNYFRNCKYPMMSSLQGTDAMGDGTFSGEDGGMIKAYNNAISGAQRLIYANAAYGSNAANATSFDAYLVSKRADTVPTSLKTVAGGTTYNNFDTSSSYDLGVAEENIDTPENVPTVVMAKAGRLNSGDFTWKFDNTTQDTNDEVISELQTAVANYKTSVKKISCGIAKDIVVIEDAGSDTPGGNTQTVNPPTASKTSGEVPEGTEITLSSSNSGDVKIYYTLNGLEPTVKNGTLYKDTEPIVISKETTIKAIAVVGTSVSSVAIFKYTIPGGTTPTPPPGPGPSGDDDDKPARGTYTLDIKDAYDTTVPNAAENEGREENKGTKEFFTLLFLGKTSNGVAAGSAISEKSSELEFEDGYKSKRYFLTSGAAKTNQASVKIVTKDKTTVTVWWQPGGTNDLNQRQLTVLNASGTAVYTSEYDNLSTEVGYVTSFELANAGTYYIGSAKSSINIYKIEVKYPENGGSEDDTIIDPPTATPDSGNIKKGASVTLNANGDIYYTMVTNETDSIVPEISDANKYTGSITITAEVGTTVIIKAIAVVEGKPSKPSTFTYNVVNDAPIPTVPLSKPEASPAPDASQTYPVNTEIGLTSKEGGTIYYTLDNTDPQTGNGEPSETSQVLAENGTITLDTAKTYTIKAFAVKEGYLPSNTATFTYTVSENSTLTQLAAPTIDPASQVVEKGDEVTVTITKAASDPDDTAIYYTIDGTNPEKDAKLLYKEPFTLTVNKTTTVKAIAVKDGAISSTAASVTYTVKNNDQTGQKEDGIYVAGLEKQYYYTGAKIIPDIEVWTYTGGVGTLLEQGVDYTVTYKNNVKPTDAAEVIVKGKGNYKGKSESKTFKIVQEDKITTGLENLKGAKIKDKIDPQVYAGEAILPDFTLTLKDNTTITYTKNTDSSSKSLYKRSDGGAMNVNVAVSNNINKGTATILVTGDNDSKGNPTSVKKTFKITPVDISSATVAPTAGTYAVNGAAPASLKVTINLNGKTVELKKGKDYTVKYSNNKNAGKATVTVTGKGNYTKKCSPEEYAVNKLDLSTLRVDAVTACEGIKVGKVKATIVDQKGNVIALKPTQYELEIYKVVEADGGTKTKGAKYEDSAEQLGAELIYVAAKAKDEDNLEQSTVTPEAEFKVGTDISKAKFKLKKGVVKEYTGSAVTLDGSEFDNPTIKVNGTEVPLVAGTHYKIESYSNNVNKGTATAVIKGVGEYSGTKTVKFKITQKTMSVDYVTPWELWKSAVKQLIK